MKPSLRKLQSIRRRLSGCAAEFCTSPPASPAYIVPASQSRQPDSGQSMSIAFAVQSQCLGAWEVREQLGKRRFHGGGCV